MRRYFIRGGIILAALFIFCGKSNAQVVELACPPGTLSIQALQTTDNVTGKLRQNYCVDNSGNVFENIVTSSNIGGIILVDGINNALTSAGLQNAINSSPSCSSGMGEIWITKPIALITTQITFTGHCATIFIKAGGQLSFNTGTNAGLLITGGNSTTHFNLKCDNPSGFSASSAIQLQASIMTGPLIQFGPTGGNDNNSNGTVVHGCNADGGGTATLFIQSNGWNGMEISGNNTTNFTANTLQLIHSFTTQVGPLNNFNLMNSGCDAAISLNDSSETKIISNRVFTTNCDALAFTTNPSDGVISAFNDYEQNCSAIRIPLLTANVKKFLSKSDTVENTNVCAAGPLAIGASGSGQAPDVSIEDMKMATNVQPITITNANPFRFVNSRISPNITYGVSVLNLIKENNIYGGTVTNNVTAANTIRDCDNDGHVPVSACAFNKITAPAGSGSIVVPLNSTFIFQDTTDAIDVRQAADSFARIRLNSSGFGGIIFGAGNVAPDAFWGRQSTNCLGMNTQLLCSSAPTIAAAGCGGAAASIVASNGTASFKINVGTTPGSACTFTMPAAVTGWNAHCDDITTQSTSVFLQKQTGAESTTSVTITNFNDVAVATAFVASDVLKCQAVAD